MKDEKSKKEPQKPKKKSFRRIVQEVDELDRQQREKARENVRRREEKKAEEYSKSIVCDKIDLLKEKQGLTENSFEEKKEEKKRSFGRKILDFFYYNKWWMGMAVFAAVLGSYLTYQLVTKPRPDMIVLLISDDRELNGKYENIENYFKNYITDFNGNGKTEVRVYTMPFDDYEISNDFVRGNSSKLSTELSMGEAVLVISNDEADKLLESQNLFVNLEDEFPDYKDVKGTGFYLNDTDFAKEIGYEGSFPKDTKIEVRAPKKSQSFYKDIQKTYNKDFPVLEQIIDEKGQKK